MTSKFEGIKPGSIVTVKVVVINKDDNRFTTIDGSYFYETDFTQGSVELVSVENPKVPFTIGCIIQYKGNAYETGTLVGIVEGYGIVRWGSDVKPSVTTNKLTHEDYRIVD